MGRAGKILVLAGVWALTLAAGEAYATIGPDIQPGARMLAASRAFGLSAGADWDGRSGEVDAVFSFQTALRRGGLLGHGTMVRVDWLPGRDDALAMGLHIPLGQPFAGRTRRRDVDVDPPAVQRIPLSTERVPAEQRALRSAHELHLVHVDEFHA